MNCRKVQSKLSQYIDGELRGNEIEAVGEHLRTCPSCGEELRKLEILRESFLSLGVEEPSGGFWWGVKSNLGEGGASAPPVARLLRWAAVGASIAAALLFAVLIFGRTQWGVSEDDHLDAWLTEVTYSYESSYWVSPPIEKFSVEDIFVENWLASRGYNTLPIRGVLYSGR
ncbi:MAG: anti-sigma factor family protein [bacterium]